MIHDKSTSADAALHVYTDDDRRAHDALMQDLTGYTQDLKRGWWAEKARREAPSLARWAWVAGVVAVVALAAAWVFG